MTFMVCDVTKTLDPYNFVNIDGNYVMSTYFLCSFCSSTDSMYFLSLSGNFIFGFSLGPGVNLPIYPLSDVFRTFDHAICLIYANVHVKCFFRIVLLFRTLLNHHVRAMFPVSTIYGFIVKYPFMTS